MENTGGKAPFGGRFLSARADSVAAFFPGFYLQEFLKLFLKLLALASSCNHFSPRTGMFNPATAGLRAGYRCFLPSLLSATF